MDSELRRYLNRIVALLTIIIGTMWVQIASRTDILTSIVVFLVVVTLIYVIFSPAYTISGYIQNISDIVRR